MERKVSANVTVPDDDTEAYREVLAARAKRATRQFRRVAQGATPRTCPICHYDGLFSAYGKPPRLDARCPKCSGLERHRLFAVLFRKRPELFGPEDSVLHFAPEASLRALFEQTVGRYETADLRVRKQLTHAVDIEAAELPSSSYTRIVCNHVLEHVNDRKALAEIHRLLVPGGRAFVTVPIVEAWVETYEDPSIIDRDARILHFGQHDHVRLYGRDIRARITEAGFSLEEFVAVEPDVRRHGLIRGETIFICIRPLEI